MEDLAAIRANAAFAIEQLGPLVDFAFGLDARSVHWVDGFLERQRSRPDVEQGDNRGLVSVIGSFLGECIVANTEGEWQWSQQAEQWGVVFPSGDAAFPFAKVGKQIRNGHEDSIASFYDIAVSYVATGGLSHRDESG